ncbi:MAG: hypothetical protein OQK29_01390 [Ignavibacteriaceae bacterium]|nr:hypothetical protein [Ignavibacteriaceae bacterium]
MDFDDIKQRVSGQDPYEMDAKYLNTCFHVRNDVIANTTDKLIVIGSLADIQVRTDWIKRLNAKPLYMVTPQHECINRLKASNRPNKQGQVALIKRWFQEFTPSGYESFVTSGN